MVHAQPPNHRLLWLGIIQLWDRITLVGSEQTNGLCLQSVLHFKACVCPCPAFAHRGHVAARFVKKYICRCSMRVASRVPIMCAGSCNLVGRAPMLTCHAHVSHPCRSRSHEGRLTLVAIVNLSLLKHGVQSRLWVCHLGRLVHVQYISCPRVSNICMHIPPC